MAAHDGGRPRQVTTVYGILALNSRRYVTTTVYSFYVVARASGVVKVTAFLSCDVSQVIR